MKNQRVIETLLLSLEPASKRRHLRQQPADSPLLLAPRQGRLRALDERAADRCGCRLVIKNKGGVIGMIDAYVRDRSRDKCGDKEHAVSEGLAALLKGCATTDYAHPLVFPQFAHL